MNWTSLWQLLQETIYFKSFLVFVFFKFLNIFTCSLVLLGTRRVSFSITKLLTTLTRSADASWLATKRVFVTFSGQLQAIVPYLMPQNGNPRFHNKLGYYCVSFFSLAKYKCSWVAGVEKKFLENKDNFFGEFDLQLKSEVKRVESCQGQGYTKCLCLCSSWPFEVTI